MRIIISILFLFFGLCLSSQDNPKSKKSIFLGLGLKHISLQDKVFSPLVYRGIGPSLNLGYLSKSINRIHFVNLQFSAQSLNPAFKGADNTDVQNTIFVLDYEFSKQKQNDKFIYFAGAGLYNYGSIRSYNFTFNDHIGIDFFSSLNALGGVSKNFGQKHYFGFTLSYPLVSYVAGKMRVPLDFPSDVLTEVLDDPENFPLGSFITSGEFNSIFNFSDLRTRLEYNYTTSNKWNVGFVYNFRFYKYSKYATIKNGSSQFSFTISYVI